MMNALLIWVEGGKSKRLITLISLWNVTHSVIKGQMVASAAQGMLREVHTHKTHLQGVHTLTFTSRQK